jgi:hypothetical protein
VERVRRAREGSLPATDEFHGDRSLAEHIERLRKWLTDVLGAPPIEDVRIVELARSEIGAPALEIAAERMHTADAFESRWAELLLRGYAWINLSCYGLHGHTMIAAIELPPGGPGAWRHGQLCPYVDQFRTALIELSAA